MFSRSLSCFVLAAGLALASCGRDEPVQPYAVEEVPLSEIAGDLAAGKTTSVAVTQAYIDRIKMYNGAVNGVIGVMPDALQQAAASDARRAAGQALGPMDGIPILIKDNIDAVGMPTTAGSFALVDNMPAQDSEVSRRLRDAGAVILGKANTSQWAGLRTTTGGLNGSTVGGTARNPYDVTRGAAGSSNGSGISAAASFAAATVGTDTTGSIVAPSNANGVVGIRPTIALISRRGIVPVSLTQDTAGPMARNVRDTAMLLTVLAGTDAGDSASVQADAHKTDYAKGLSTEALRDVRIGVYRGSNGFSERTQAVFDEALGVLTAQGARLVDIPDAVLEDLSQEQRLIMIYDIKEDMAAYLEHAPAAVKSRTLADLIAFNKTDPRENIYGQDLFEAAEATTGRSTPEYIQTVDYARRRAGADGYARAMSDYEVAAIVAPTGGPAGLIGGGRPAGAAAPAGGGHPAAITPKGARKPSISGVAALAGYPNLSVPMGYVDGMPVGLSFVGPPWSEDQLLAFGYAYEQASKKRVAPTAYKNVTASN